LKLFRTHVSAACKTCFPAGPPGARRRPAGRRWYSPRWGSRGCKPCSRIYLLNEQCSQSMHRESGYRDALQKSCSVILYIIDTLSTTESAVDKSISHHSEKGLKHDTHFTVTLMCVRHFKLCLQDIASYLWTQWEALLSAASEQLERGWRSLLSPASEQLERGWRSVSTEAGVEPSGTEASQWQPFQWMSR